MIQALSKSVSRCPMISSSTSSTSSPSRPPRPAHPPRAGSFWAMGDGGMKEGEGGPRIVSFSSSCMLRTGQLRHILLGGPRSVKPYPIPPRPSPHCTGACLGPLRLSIRNREHYSTLAFHTEVCHLRRRAICACSLPAPLLPAAARVCLSARANGPPRTKSGTPARVGRLVLNRTD